jgi:hypothetical protein
LPGAVEGRGEDIGDDCSASAKESTIIAFCPPVSAMNGTIGPGIRRQNGLFRSINRRADNSSLLHLQQICSKTSPYGCKIHRRGRPE